MHFVGLAGMPRRIPDYNVMFANFNMISSVGEAVTFPKLLLPTTRFQY